MMEQAIEGLSTAVRRILQRTARDRLAELKEEARARGAEPDWPWNGVVLSFATMGGVAHAARIADLLAEAQWDKVIGLSSEERLTLFKRIVNPRRPQNVTNLETIFQEFLRRGGPATVRSSYDELKGPDDRISFFKSFKGIGDKYARNIPMDAFDDVVRSSFAIDSRLQTILDAVFGTEDWFAREGYSRAEKFLRLVAEKSGLDPWELDRLLFEQTDAVIRELSRRD